jgi:mono/diheme cytochrome c family protein
MRRATGNLLIALAVSQAPPALAEGDADNGRELSIRHCARCHVVGDYNPTGGIGSTPSFQWMKMLPDYVERLRTFFARHPHPVFVRVPGYARWAEGSTYAPEFTMTADDIEDILAFVETLERPL